LNLKRGEIYWVNLEPTKGAEIRKMRPCVLVGATPINQARRTVVVVPLSSATAVARPPLTVKVTCLGRQVVAVCDQIRAVDKGRLAEHIGSLDIQEITDLDNALRQVLAL